MKFSYDNIVQKNYGRYWYVPIIALPPVYAPPPKKTGIGDEEEEEKKEEIKPDNIVLDENVKVGSIILFGTPRKIVDVFLITEIKEKKILLSPTFFSMLWKDLGIVPPIPPCYQTPRRNHPVKLEDGHVIDKYFNENKEKLFREIYSSDERPPIL